MQLVKVNPNDNNGGGGCLCHPIKSTDTKGPFIVFEATETDSNLSPSAVLCAGCLKECNKLLRNKSTEMAAGGEVNNQIDVVTEI